MSLSDLVVEKDRFKLSCGSISELEKKPWIRTANRMVNGAQYSMILEKKEDSGKKFLAISLTFQLGAKEFVYARFSAFLVRLKPYKGEKEQVAKTFGDLKKFEEDQVRGLLMVEWETLLDSKEGFLKRNGIELIVTVYATKLRTVVKPHYQHQGMVLVSESDDDEDANDDDLLDLD